MGPQVWLAQTHAAARATCRPRGATAGRTTPPNYGQSPIPTTLDDLRTPACPTACARSTPTAPAGIAEATLELVLPLLRVTLSAAEPTRLDLGGMSDLAGGANLGAAPSVALPPFVCPRHDRIRGP